MSWLIAGRLPQTNVIGTTRLSGETVPVARVAQLTRIESGVWHLAMAATRRRTDTLPARVDGRATRRVLQATLHCRSDIQNCGRTFAFLSWTASRHTRFYPIEFGFHRCEES